jgi:Rps23 Pro-64 3,4-dihydroxylase Tpa1-like proline 4-hydroxylase
MNILNNNLKVEKITDPYNIWIIDNFLKEDILQNIIKVWPSSDDESWHKGHTMIEGKTNILEQGMRGISKLEKMPEYIAKIVKYLHSKAFTNKIEKLLKIDDLTPDSTMRWSGMRTMLSGSFQLIHSDARKSPETGLRKEITCLLYFNENYNKEKDEGCLEIWNDDMSICTHEITPSLNRLVVFLNSDTSFHGVPIVKSERRAITFSILKEGEATKRSKALFVARPNDSEEIKLEGIKRSQINDIK